MTEPAVPPPDVPEPARADARSVRGVEVAQGFGIGLVTTLAAGTASSMVAALVNLVLEDSSLPWIGGLVFFAAPAVAYGLLMRHFARIGRRGWALGMALFVGVTLLLVAACFGIVFLSFR